MEMDHISSTEEWEWGKGKPGERFNGIQGDWGERSCEELGRGQGLVSRELEALCENIIEEREG